MNIKHSYLRITMPEHAGKAVDAKFISILLAIILLTALMPSITALAANDDFSMTYAFYPGAVGHRGGFVRLILHVKNEGAKNIDEVNVVINLKNGFSGLWTGTILPGEEKKIVFDNVHFTDEDINTQRILQVAINNDGDANPDGIQMESFTMRGAGTLYRLTYDLSPRSGTLHPGDTLSGNIYIDNNNTADGMIIEDLYVTFIIEVRGAENYFIPVGDLGDFDLGETIELPFSYTLTEDDITDRLRIDCHVKYSLAGVNYGNDNYSMNYTVEEVPPATERPTARPTERPTAHPTERSTGTPDIHTEAPATAMVSSEPTVATISPTSEALLTASPVPTHATSPSPFPAAAQAQSPLTIPRILLIIIIVMLMLVIAALIFLLRKRRMM